MDPSGMNDALSLITKVVSLGKRATQVQYEEALMAARQEILKCKEENIGLREKLLELEQLSKFELVKGHGWIVNVDDPDGPKFCTSCFSGASKQLTPLLSGDVCPIHKFHIR